MTAHERRLLEEAIASLRRNPVWGKELLLGLTLVVASLLCVVLTFAVALSNPHPVVGGLVCGLLCIAGIVLFFFGGNMVSGWLRWGGTVRKLRAEREPLVREALADGRVEVTRVVAQGVIELEEFEDEGQGFVFDIGGGQSLLLKGQNYLPEDQAAPWPSTEFELVRTAKHRLWVGLFNRGQALTPQQRVPLTEFPSDFVWAEEERIVPLPPEELVARLRREGLRALAQSHDRLRPESD
jgi:hypothetical protein